MFSGHPPDPNRYSRKSNCATSVTCAPIRRPKRGPGWPGVAECIVVDFAHLLPAPTNWTESLLSDIHRYREDGSLVVDTFEGRWRDDRTGEGGTVSKLSCRGHSERGAISRRCLLESRRPALALAQDREGVTEIVLRRGPLQRYPLAGEHLERGAVGRVAGGRPSFASPRPVARLVAVPAASMRESPGANRRTAMQCRRILASTPST